jgi:hypothetical protein
MSAIELEEVMMDETRDEALEATVAGVGVNVFSGVPWTCYGQDDGYVPGQVS